jgi:hypothetical protein
MTALEMQREFATRGFADCPLNIGQMYKIYRAGLSCQDLIGIGCDMYAASFDSLGEAIDWYRSRKA